jgi:hypothetical protein
MNSLLLICVLSSVVRVPPSIVTSDELYALLVD